MRLWLDDIRSMPNGYDIHCKTAKEAIKLIMTGTVTEISFDHDLGEDDGTGYDVAFRVEMAAYNGEIPAMAWRIHSSNPVGRERIKQAMSNADKYWAEGE